MDHYHRESNHYLYYNFDLKTEFFIILLKFIMNQVRFPAGILKFDPVSKWVSADNR